MNQHRLGWCVSVVYVTVLSPEAAGSQGGEVFGEEDPGPPGTSWTARRRRLQAGDKDGQALLPLQTARYQGGCHQLQAIYVGAILYGVDGMSIYTRKHA